MKNSLGFTLVELIIVIVLLGVLAATAIPRYIGAGDDAKVSTLEQLLTRIQSTVELNRGFAAVKKRLQGEQVLILDEVGAYSFNMGYPQNKSEASTPNLYFFDLMTLTKGPRTILESNDNQRIISFGELQLFENDNVSRLGYGSDELVDDNCYVEYQLTAAGEASFDMVITGC